jgi:PadR family transcriptional regulator
MERKSFTADLLPGSVDLLLLRVLTAGPMHGYGIAQRLRQVANDVLQVGESSLYPALQRLLVNGWAKAEWEHRRTIAGRAITL